MPLRFSSGRHFLQIPGPTNVPDRVLRAMDLPTIDHRGPDFGKLGRAVLEGLRPVFGTRGPVAIYPGSGTGAWEGALQNTLSPGDKVLGFEHGVFAGKWAHVVEQLGLEAERLPCDWRRGIPIEALEQRLRADDGSIRALAVVHNETSTAITNPIAEVRRVLDHVGHTALLLVDTVSSLGSIECRHDEWGVDVSIAASQKGLMLPPGLCFHAISEKALAANAKAKLARSYWDWRPMLDANATGYFPYTPATNMLFGLREALALLAEEGLAQVYARHHRLAEATRRAVTAWGLELYCLEPEARSDTVTAVRVGEDLDAEALRREILESYDLSLGAGLGPLKSEVFRIGHLGSFNELMLAGTLSGIELGLRTLGRDARGGVTAALDYLAETP